MRPSVKELPPILEPPINDPIDPVLLLRIDDARGIDDAQQNQDPAEAHFNEIPSLPGPVGYPIDDDCYPPKGQQKREQAAKATHR
jgi:hypothetical protein